jgi:hypothetical protein
MTEPEAPAYVLVILPAQDIRLPEVLKHIEAGRIVLVIKANPNRTDPEPGAEHQSTARPPRDRST